MNKEERIKRYGEDAYEKILARNRAHYKAHREQERARNKKYREDHPEASKEYREEHPEELKARHKKYNEEHPEQVKANQHEANRKDGKYYDKHLSYMQTGIQGERHQIRKKHAHQYKPYKDIVAPDSQIHHEWVPDTSEYRGVALVEAKPHQYGIVDVIQILDGKITLLTEEEVKRGKKQNEK